MHSFRRLALLLALGLPAAIAVPAQSSSSNPPAPAAGQAQKPDTATQIQMTVQQRIRLRREQRRAAAMHDAYDHLYEAFVGTSFLRGTPGRYLQKTNLYSWDVGLTRYYSQRLGITADGRGYYGSPYVGLNTTTNSAITQPQVSEYAAMIGPTYRFYMQPKYSVSGRVMGGFMHGNFSGDLGGFKPASLGLFADGNTYAFSAAVLPEYNLTPSVSFRLGAEFVATGFGSTMQRALGCNGGVIYRFGKR